MKYRLLTIEELKDLEPEFIRFLALNGITAPDWTLIKESEPLRMQHLLELFSDMVLDKVLGKIQFLEFRGWNEFSCYKFLDDKFITTGIRVIGNEPVDFSDSKKLQTVIDEMESKDAFDVRTFIAEKDYLEPRNIELFKLIRKGCMISDGKLFNLLKEMNKKQG